MPTEYIQSIKAKCRDCYFCLRSRPFPAVFDTLAGAIDVVFTFEETAEWFEEEKIDLERLPYMREQAESMSNAIISSSPNAIFVVTLNMIIIDINPTAERVFRTARANAVDRHISEFMPPEIFQQVAETGMTLRDEVSFTHLDYAARRTVFRENSQRVTIAVLSDCTEEKRHLETVQHLRRQTLEKAQGVINKQMEVAQKIACLLGETTAEIKVLLTQLMRTMSEEEDTEVR